MGQKINCDIIRDLLPTYIEKMNSESSNKLIEEHLKECSECREIYEEMKKDIHIDTVPEVKKLKSFLNKTKLAYAMIILGILSAVGIATCLIVNLAVDKKLSWSLIVTGAVLYGYSIFYTVVKSSEDRIRNTLVVVTLGVIPFLAIIQYVSYYFIGNEKLWLIPSGVEIALVWIVIAWISFIIYRKTKLNLFSLAAVVVFISIFGSILTLFIAGTNDLQQCIINGAINFMAALLLAIVGYVYDRRKKKKI